MRPLTEGEIRASFVNTTKGEAKRLAVPKDLAARPWADLDFLGWRDPGSPERTYLVAETATGLVGVALRKAPGGQRRTVCSLCLTTHPGDGVALMTARKARRRDNSVGVYLCSDLACSLYLRGKKDAGPGARLPESIALEAKIERTAANMTAFLRKVTTA
jgi:hypothetical protein